MITSLKARRRGGREKPAVSFPASAWMTSPRCRAVAGRQGAEGRVWELGEPRPMAPMSPARSQPSCDLACHNLQGCLPPLLKTWTSLRASPEFDFLLPELEPLFNSAWGRRAQSSFQSIPRDGGGPAFPQAFTVVGKSCST